MIHWWNDIHQLLSWGVLDDTVNISGKKKREWEKKPPAKCLNQMYFVDDMPVFEHAFLISCKLFWIQITSECKPVC